MESFKGKRVHFVGIGGIGMSGIAKVLLGLGSIVTGSDISDSHIIEELRCAGAFIHIGHKPENLGKVDILVVSSAISKDNPEILEAKKRGIPIVRRGEFLATLMRGKRGIAVSGTHGKTTTTSLIAKVFIDAGTDPTVFIGGEMEDIKGNARLGFGNIFIAEADESDGSFLSFFPEVSVITNVEPDHLENYGTWQRFYDSFVNFANRCNFCLISDQGVCLDLRGRIKTEHVTFGLSQKAQLRAKKVRYEERSLKFLVDFRGKELGLITLSIPGIHNIYNSLGCIGVALYFGLPFCTVRESLKEFGGVKRRFEIKGEYRSITIIDDYAHHPTEIKATIETAKALYNKRIVAVFQPHRYTRFKYFYNEFIEVFKDVEDLVVTDIYGAFEEPINGVDSRNMVKDLLKYGTKAKFISDMKDIKDYLLKELKPGDLLLTIGAGDIWKVAKEVSLALKESGE